MAYTTIACGNLANPDAGTIVTKTIVGSGLTGTAAYSITGLTDEELTILITNDGATGIASFYASSATGVFAGYCEASKGDLAVVVGGGVTKAVKLDQARFRQQDATVRMGVGFTGSAYAFQ